MSEPNFELRSVFRSNAVASADKPQLAALAIAQPMRGRSANWSNAGDFKHQLPTTRANGAKDRS
jgi:hypothetical protein